MEDHVYVIGEPTGSVVKIGFSNNPRLRLIGIQNASPRLVEIRWTTPGGNKLEKALHRRFRAFALRGEWFDFRTVDPVLAVQEGVRCIERGEDGIVDPPVIIGETHPDCVCGHKHHHHHYEQARACWVTGWHEWMDCQCVSYTPIPFREGLPEAQQAANEDPRFAAVFTEVALTTWPSGGRMVPGHFAEDLASRIVRALLADTTGAAAEDPKENQS